MLRLGCEDSNVILTETGGASQMRGSECFQNKHLFLGYTPMGFSRNSARSKVSNG